MLTLVTGGAASGKSAYAERLLDGWTGPKIYLATMRPGDGECRTRIEKHRAARAGRGFETVEQFVRLGEVALPAGCAVLLECLPNLAANELFDPDGAGEGAEEAILSGVEALCRQSAEVVVVSGEVFSDGGQYDPGTERYLRLLGRLHCALAERAGRVVEVVCGIPLPRKGTLG